MLLPCSRMLGCKVVCWKHAVAVRAPSHTRVCVHVAQGCIVQKHNRRVSPGGKERSKDRSLTLSEQKSLWRGCLVMITTYLVIARVPLLLYRFARTHRHINN